MRKSKEDALFEKIVSEAAKVKSADLEKRAIEWNREPIPEEARARFMRELDKVYPEGGNRTRNRTPARNLRKAIPIAIACVVLVIVLIPATSEAGRRRMNELMKRVMPGYTEYRNDGELSGFEGKTYVPAYIPEGFTRVEKDVDSILFYRNEKDAYLYFTVSIHADPSRIRVYTKYADVEQIFIGEISGDLVSYDGWICVVWTKEGYLFTVEGTLEKEEILKIARNLKEK